MAAQYNIRAQEVNNKITTYFITTKDGSDLDPTIIDEIIVTKLPTKIPGLWKDENKYQIATLHETGWRNGTMFMGNGETSYYNPDQFYDESSNINSSSSSAAALTVISS